MIPATVVLADDHQLIRQGLRVLLEAEGFRVVAEAGDGLSVYDLVERHRPNLLIVDVMLPGLRGLEVVKRVSGAFPLTRAIVLSMHASEAYVLEALRNGAAAYVVKEADSAEIVRAAREVLGGRRYLSPPLSERALETYVRAAEGAVSDAYDTLTSREREILQLVAEGHTNAEIAGRLSISARTAETHRANLIRKLNLKNQTDLIRYALQRGILPQEVP